MRSRKSSVSGRASSTRSFVVPRRPACERITGGASAPVLSTDEVERAETDLRPEERARFVFAMMRKIAYRARQVKQTLAIAVTESAEKTVRHGDTETRRTNGGAMPVTRFA